jgi:hypothetical protein
VFARSKYAYYRDEVVDASVHFLLKKHESIPTIKWFSNFEVATLQTIEYPGFIVRGEQPRWDNNHRCCRCAVLRRTNNLRDFTPRNIIAQHRMVLDQSLLDKVT